MISTTSKPTLTHLYERFFWFLVRLIDIEIKTIPLTSVDLLIPRHNRVAQFLLETRQISETRTRNEETNQIHSTVSLRNDMYILFQWKQEKHFETFTILKSSHVLSVTPQAVSGWCEKLWSCHCIPRSSPSCDCSFNEHTDWLPVA